MSVVWGVFRMSRVFRTTRLASIRLTADPSRSSGLRRRLVRSPRAEREEGEGEREAGQSERRDRHVAELVDPLDAAAAGRRSEARLCLLDDAVLYKQVVDREAGPTTGNGSK